MGPAAQKQPRIHYHTTVVRAACTMGQRTAERRSTWYDRSSHGACGLHAIGALAFIAAGIHGGRRGRVHNAEGGRAAVCTSTAWQGGQRRQRTHRSVHHFRVAITSQHNLHATNTSTATRSAQALPDGVNGSPHTPHGTRTSWTTTGSVRSVAQQRLEEAAMFASV